MVQVLTRKQPTFGEQVASGIQQGAQTGTEFAKMFAKQGLEQQAKKSEMAKKMQLSQEYQTKLIEGGLDPLTAQVLGLEMSGLTSGGSTKSTINALREKESNEWFNQMGLGGQPPSETPSETATSTGETPLTTEEGSRKKPKRDYEAEIKKWEPALASANPQKRDFAKNKIEGLRKEQEFEFKKGQAAQKQQFQTAQSELQEAKPTIEYANKLSLSLPDELQNLEGLEQALKAGDFSFFSLDNLAEMTGLEFFRTPAGAQFKSNLKDYFLGDVKGVGGKGLNQWLEKQLNDAMLKIGRDNEANETVLAGFQAKYDRRKMWLDEYRKLYKQQKEKAGIKGDIGLEVSENLKPYYEARQKQLEAEIKAIQKSGKLQPSRPSLEEIFK